MSDIVERLRETASCADYVVDREIAAEAADTITRLAAEVEKLNSELTDALTDLATARQDNASFMPILNRLTAEIERLKAALREIRRYSNELYATGVANAALSGDEP